MFMEKIVDVLERCANSQLQGVINDGPGLAADSQPPTEPYILRRPESLFRQWGDLPTEFSQGVITQLPCVRAGFPRAASVKERREASP